MNKNAIYTLVYALIVIAGGTAGYYFAGSIPSLISSAIFGTLLLLFSIALFREKRWSLYAGFYVGSFLTCFFSYRFGMNPAIPSFVMAFVSGGYSLLMRQK